MRWRTISVALSVVLTGCIAPFTSPEPAGGFTANEALSRMNTSEGVPGGDSPVRAVLGIESDAGFIGDRKLVGSLKQALDPPGFPLNDTQLTDGRAPHWLAVRAEEEWSNDSRWDLTVRGGTVGDSPVEAALLWIDVQGGAPVGRRWIDSTEAAERAAELSSGWSDNKEDQGSTVWMLLQRQPRMDHPYWVMSSEFAGGIRLEDSVILDAVTGEKRNLTKVFPQVDPEQESQAVPIPPGGTEINFELSRRSHGYLEVVVNPEDRPPGMEMRAELTGPEGRTRADRFSSTNTTSLLLFAPKEGMYDLYLSAGTGDTDAGYVDAEIKWCAADRAPNPLDLYEFASTCES